MLDWVDGRPAAELSVRDRGLAYGDGLFETLAVRAGTPRLLERHLARLEEGCRRLAIPLDAAALRQELLAFCAALGDGVAKLIVTRGEGLRGYAPPAEPRRGESSPDRRVRPIPSATGSKACACSPAVRAWPSSPCWPASSTSIAWSRSSPVPSGATPGMPKAHAGRARAGGGGVFSNLLLVLDGTLVAPDLRCGVAGVMRAELLERAEGIGVPLAIRDVSMAELATADEVFLCNSQFGIWPVRALDEHVWPVGELTRKLQDQLRDDLDF